MAGAKLIVVASREPYIHVRQDAQICCLRPASGLTTALDPVMRACRGTWVAHGSGNADRLVVDDRDRIAVPPESPRYSLRRVWLTAAEEQGYYYGVSSSALWPLCHIVYARPHFDSRDWDQYWLVNRKFSDVVLEEASEGPAVVFIQDYHFALLPSMLKNARPDLTIAQFWHIPWPNREVFRVCPWRVDILEGLLGNDLLAFQTQSHCNNFLETVDRELESRVDRERFSATFGGHTTRVRAQPISIDPAVALRYLPRDIATAEQKIRRELRLRDEAILLGVDRVDYTKGIAERFRAVERLLLYHPELAERVSLVQVGAPSRVEIPAYRSLNDELRALADEINRRHSRSSWRPIIFLQEHHDAERIFVLNRIAAACVVSSLHDGMNLVAKEFVATRDDLRGVLVLSEFAGAAQELDGALSINPHDTDDFAQTLELALAMSPDEQEQRMRRMRQQVTEHNVYRWAGVLLSEIVRLGETAQLAQEAA